MALPAGVDSAALVAMTKSEKSALDVPAMAIVHTMPVVV